MAKAFRVPFRPPQSSSFDFSETSASRSIPSFPESQPNVNRSSDNAELPGSIDDECTRSRSDDHVFQAPHAASAVTRPQDTQLVCETNDAHSLVSVDASSSVHPLVAPVDAPLAASRERGLALAQVRALILAAVRADGSVDPSAAVAAAIAVAAAYPRVRDVRGSLSGEIIRERWVSDEESETCGVCGATFTAFLRRHHCRHCGAVCCDDCAPKRPASASDEHRIPFTTRKCCHEGV